MSTIVEILKQELIKRGYPLLKAPTTYHGTIHINYKDEELLIDLSLAGVETDTLEIIDINDPHSIEKLFNTIGPPNPTISIT